VYRDGLETQFDSVNYTVESVRKSGMIEPQKFSLKMRSKDFQNFLINGPLEIYRLHDENRDIYKKARYESRSFLVARAFFLRP